MFEQLRKTAMGKKGALVLLAIVIAYAWIAISGPQGVQALLEKRREIRQLQEQNAALTREIEHRRDRIRRLEDSPQRAGDGDPQAVEAPAAGRDDVHSAGRAERGWRQRRQPRMKRK